MKREGKNRKERKGRWWEGKKKNEKKMKEGVKEWEWRREGRRGEENEEDEEEK